MIVGSILLILVAVGLLVLGLADGSSTLLISSIAASLLAAVALVVGARQAAALRAARDSGDEPSVPPAGSPDRRYGPVGDGQPADHPESGHYDPVSVAAADNSVPHPRTTSGPDRVGRRQPPDPTDPVSGTPLLVGEPVEDEFVEDDEPPAQVVGPLDEARLARLTTEVLVIDGRPRYHLSGCAHLTGRGHEPVPVAEAVELGFTPCAWCTPVTTLLTDARPA